QGAVMVHVITHKPIRLRRLRGRGFQSWMSIDHPDSGVKPHVRDPPQADLATRAGYIFDQPFDRIPGIATFIDVARAFLVWYLRTHILELTLGHPSATHVLVGKDVAFRRKER